MRDWRHLDFHIFPITCPWPMSCTADNLYFLVSAAIFGRQVKRPRLGKCTREPPKGVSRLGKCAHDTPQGVSGTHVWAKARMKRPRVFLAHNIRPRVFLLDLGVKHTPKPQVGTSRWWTSSPRASKRSTAWPPVWCLWDSSTRRKGPTGRS